MHCMLLYRKILKRSYSEIKRHKNSKKNNLFYDFENFVAYGQIARFYIYLGELHYFYGCPVRNDLCHNSIMYTASPFIFFSIIIWYPAPLESVEYNVYVLLKHFYWRWKLNSSKNLQNVLHWSVVLLYLILHLGLQFFVFTTWHTWFTTWHTWHTRYLTDFLHWSIYKQNILPFSHGPKSFPVRNGFYSGNYISCDVPNFVLTVFFY